MLTSKLCAQADFAEPFYDELCAVIWEKPRMHRKQWEFVMILQALRERSMLGKGKKGLGFAVGEEPLPSAFASLGCKVLATDLDPEDERAKFGMNGQLSYGLDTMYKPNILDRNTYDQLVSYRPVNMNAVPEDLRRGEFDFTWSSCSFEHLGSIRKGLDFMVNQMDCLKSGGWAVHTTEFNFSSDLDTLDNQVTVLFRRQDIVDLKMRLESEGHYVGRVNFDTGSDQFDNFIDTPPYKPEPHLKLRIGRYKSTSILLIVQKNKNKSSEPFALGKSKER